MTNIKLHIKQLCMLFAVIFTALSVASCTDNVNEDNDSNSEFTVNWKERNAAFFDSVMTVACTEVAQAQAQYGDQWEDHCDWRVFRSYSKRPGLGGNSHDSICVRIIERSTQADGISPLYLDSVKVNYMGHLIPTQSYAKGRVFDHSGFYENESHVFSDSYSVPSRFSVANTVEGYTTALLHMTEGDRWMVYIPQELGYTYLTQGVLPAYSTLCFDMQLKAVARRGTSF